MRGGAHQKPKTKKTDTNPSMLIVGFFGTTAAAPARGPPLKVGLPWLETAGAPPVVLAPQAPATAPAPPVPSGGKAASEAQAL
eukprot:CAMPEP_0180515134 /NCGR_PEP_ID=MMETSP1036_2-20121128/53146_1 /TAXON_ID=632150 /ORGANISM="Azadinium spinosum, Strain 3D9" /LENGTH=82 /DNA_ID=CAMNT_0022526693 /DNA_START=108 /DNA_END=352 /DNA_ORIENTATION=-